MSEQDRQRRLHVQNRLEELRFRHGRDLEDAVLPEWLESYEGFRAAGGLPDQPITPVASSSRSLRPVAGEVSRPPVVTKERVISDELGNV